jgi:hypothetical protein
LRTYYVELTKFLFRNMAVIAGEGGTSFAAGPYLRVKFRWSDPLWCSHLIPLGRWSMSKISGLEGHTPYVEENLEGNSSNPFEGDAYLEEETYVREVHSSRVVEEVCLSFEVVSPPLVVGDLPLVLCL